MKKPFLIGLALVLILAAVFGRQWWIKSTSEVAALAAGPAPAAIQPDTSVVVLTGVVSAGGSEPVLAKKRGRVRSIYFSKGEYVKRGAIVAKLADYSFVTAPHDGFLGERQIEVGQYVAPATVVSSITKCGYLLVPVGTRANRMTHVQAGDSVQVWATARPTRVVTGVAAAAGDTTGGIRLEIRLPSRSPLHVGEVASVQLHR
jgi:multidrug efflux pump subunit AcrA (membrane-fusion protein)